jgi:chromosome segregation ATPase
VTEDLGGRADALPELADRIARTRREHEALFAVEEELEACREEHDEIVRRIEELRRLEALAAGLPEIRDQHDSLARRLETMTSPAAEAEEALAATAHRVLVLREDLFARLDVRTRELVEKVRDSEVRWAEQRQRILEGEAQLRDKVAEYEKLRAERDTVLRAAAAHAEIDRELVERLAAVREGGPLDKVRAVLSDVQARLDQVDGALAEALARYDRFAEEHRQVLAWRDAD